jgi:hypothetical protein
VPVVIAPEQVVVGKVVWYWWTLGETPRAQEVTIADIKGPAYPGVGTIRVEWGGFPAKGGSAWVFAKDLFATELELLRARVKR